MANFSRPEYASYKQFCRKHGFWNRWEQDDDLPSLSDWLEMLEEKGMEAVTLERTNHVWFARGFNAEGYGGALGGPTREEAAARLYMAVKKPSAEPAGPAPGSR